MQKKYVTNVAINASVNATSGAFSGDIKSSSTTARTISSEWSYASYDLLIQKKKLSLNMTIDVMRNFLTSDFKNYIATQSPETIIRAFGTHVFTDVELGGKLRVEYKSKTNNLNKTAAVTAGLSASMGNKFGVTTNYSQTTDLVTSNKESTLSYYTVGGDPSRSIIGACSATETSPINTQAWQESCNKSNMGLINVQPGSMIPIYEFVTDPAKKAALKAAVESYLKGFAIELVAPLYRYHNASIHHHFYTTNWAELGNGKDSWKLEKIQCYIYPEAAVAKEIYPLYRHYNKSTRDHFYTVTAGNYSGYAFEWVQGGIFLTQKMGTIPLYRYYNQSIHDHFFTTDWTELGAGNSSWKYERIEGYVYNNSSVN